MLFLAKFRIEFKRNECIGAGPCAAVDPDDFDISPDDGKANLKGGKEVGGVWVKEIVADSADKAMQAVDVCPVAIISVKKIQD
mgnify:CR=1 FL=1